MLHLFSHSIPQRVTRERVQESMKLGDDLHTYLLIILCIVLIIHKYMYISMYTSGGREERKANASFFRNPKVEELAEPLKGSDRQETREHKVQRAPSS